MTIVLGLKEKLARLEGMLVKEGQQGGREIFLTREYARGFRKLGERHDEEKVVLGISGMLDE